MAEYKIFGLYKIIPTKESILRAASYHEYHWLIGEHGEYVDEIYWGNHENLGLFEMQVSGFVDPPELLNSILLSDQAPYMEFYLDPTGSQLITEDDAIESEDRRICFFLHFIDLQKPIKIDQEEVDLPPWSELPERLEPFAHYLPVD